MTKGHSLVYEKRKNKEDKCLSERLLQKIQQNNFYEPRLSSSTPTAYPSFSSPLSKSRYHLAPHPSSKVLSATPGSSFHVAQDTTEDMQTSPPVVTHMTCGLIPLNLLAKTTTKLFLVGGILFLLFLYNFEFVLDFLHFPREVFDIMYEDLLHGYYILPFELSGKVLPVTLTLLFFSFIL